MPRTSDDLGSECAQLVGGRFRRAVVPEVADRDPVCAALREAKGDGAADAARAARDEDVHGRRGSGWSTGADEGSSSQPMRSGDSR